MRSPLCTLVLALSLLPACGNEENKATDTNTTGVETGTTTGTTGTTTTTTTTGTPGTTSTTETTGTTGPETPGTTTGPEPTGTTGTTGETTGGTSTGGVMPGGACATDNDCALHSDCCDCFATGKPDESPMCNKDCNQPMCELQGISQATCRFGTCVTEKVICDPLKVSCDAKPPACPMGQLPTVKDKCWSGQCVPATSCDIVTDCNLCPDNFMCVYMDAQIPMPPTCEPIPAQCDAQIDCECAGKEVCVDQFNSCSKIKDNELHCACPAC